MKIRLRIIAVEAQNLPTAGEDGCSVMEIADGQTVDHALASLALPDDALYLTLVNEDTVPIADRGDRHLQESDLLTVFSPIKGG